MVHFPPLPSTAYGFSSRSPGISLKGFPHSEIPGSKLVCSSPGLIAAYRVLHRLLAPRHSPYALSSLTTSVLGSRRSAPRFRPPASSQRPEPGASSSSPLNVSSLFTSTHCECVFRKELPFAGYSVVKEPDWLRLDAAAIQYNSFIVATRPVPGRPSEARLRLSFADQTPAERRMVENTGLEPVTSWLQTRRSPS